MMYSIREKYKHLIPKPEKGLGQHFLRNHIVAKRISDFVWSNNIDYVLEIGPGSGDLTFALLEYGKVVAVEVDTRLKPFWDQIQQEIPHLEIIWKDILEITEEAIPQGNYNVAGNLPYMIGTAIISHLIKHFPRWNLGVFMLQREVARRIRATEGRERSSLSVWIQTYFEIISTLKVKPGAFYPPPKVMSEVIFLKRRSSPLCNVGYNEWEHFLKIIFKQKRKTLANNLKNAGFSKECIDYILKDLGITMSTRAEEVSIELLCHVYQLLYSKNICKDKSDS